MGYEIAVSIYSEIMTAALPFAIVFGIGDLIVCTLLGWMLGGASCFGRR